MNFPTNIADGIEAIGGTQAILSRADAAIERIVGKRNPRSIIAGQDAARAAIISKDFEGGGALRATGRDDGLLDTAVVQIVGAGNCGAVCIDIADYVPAAIARCWL